MATISNGDHDAYIDVIARSVADLGRPVTIRLMHEVNGNWYPWGSGVNGNRDGEFVRAWQHVHDRSTALGVTDVEWLWAPNAVCTGAQQLAPPCPGDAYVDAVGVSNYNWGDDRPDGWDTSWTTFGVCSTTRSPSSGRSPHGPSGPRGLSVHLRVSGGCAAG